MKYRCPLRGNSAEKFRCHNSEDFYYIYQTGQISGWICSEDPHFYQACDRRMDGYTITDGEQLCNNWLCQDTHIFSRIFSLTSLRSKRCDKNQDCENNMDETNCSAKSILRSGREVETSYICNHVCETDDCEDEASCNGFTYGMYCEYPPFSFSGYPIRYVPPKQICDGLKQCAGREDEKQCSEDNSITTCRIGASFLEIVKPVHNFTRCPVLSLGPLKP